jgi:beta-phosphoglucomutase-like phosphatase (HAD superfamily)
MNLIQACIFDLDGVIVDTAVYHYQAWKRLANELGFDFTEEDNEKLKGVSRMASLDLIISCDTSVAHLAGALGRPVWTALKRNAEWRWMLQDTTTPWYPTMTLFRQAQYGDWAPVFAAMHDRLAALLDKA